MFSLEIIFINPSEDLFVQDVCLSTIEERDEYRQKFANENKKFLVNEHRIGSLERFRRDDGKYQIINCVKYFNTVVDASTYFHNLINYNHPYRTLERQYNIDNNILSESNVIDNNGVVVENLHGCSTNHCIRYGNCVTVDEGGCFTEIENLSRSMQVFHIPVESVKRI